MQRERALDADAERDLPDGERLADAAARARDDHALEDLHTLAVPFHHADVHLDGVAGAEGREIGAQERLLDQVGTVHGNGRRLYQRVCADPAADVFGIGYRRRSGRFLVVFPTAAARRQASTAAWSPDTNTSGTRMPRHSCGRV